MLRKAGFQEISGKGSHTNWIHPLYHGKITLSGQEGADAKTYQEKLVKQGILEIKKGKKHDEI